MINLLLLADKKALTHEYHRRVVLVVGGLLLGIIMVALVICVSFYLLLLAKSVGLKENLTAIVVGEKVGRFDELKLVLDEASREVKILIEPAEAKRLSLILEEIVQVRTAGIRLGQVILRRAGPAKGSMTLGGTAATRDQFLGFVQALESAVGIEKVGYPVSTLIRERSINFSLAIDFNYAGN